MITFRWCAALCRNFSFFKIVKFFDSMRRYTDEFLEEYSQESGDYKT